MSSTQKVQQEERLSKKHIQTLGYVQELMNENKKLRQVIDEYEQQKLHCDDLHLQNEAAQKKIKLIQEQTLAKADEISAALVRKHQEEQIKLKREKLEAEQRLETQTREMAAEIERLQKLNASLEEALKAKAAISANQSELREQNEMYKVQISNLQSKVSSLTESNANQLKEMKRLEQEVTQSKLTKEELKAANQMIKELRNRVKQLENTNSELESSLGALQDNEMKSYKNKLIRALEEVSNLQQDVYRKESDIEELKQKIRNLMDELEDVQKQRFSLERQIEKQRMEINELKILISRLKSKGEETCSFKEFVAVKRELASLQEEYDKLKERSLQTTAGFQALSASTKSSSKQKITPKLR